MDKITLIFLICAVITALAVIFGWLEWGRKKYCVHGVLSPDRNQKYQEKQ